MAGCYFSILDFLFLCYLWGAWLQYNTDAHQDGCRRVKFLSPEISQYLEGHVFINLTIGIYTPCEHRCVMERKCVSVNIRPTVEDKVICELSDSDHMQHPDDLKPRPGWTYRGIQNLCCTNPCLNNGKCLMGYTDKKYLCECAAGFTGENCEIDIDECNNGYHNCSKNASCVNTPGTFNCTCEPGFTGDGRLCLDIDECTKGIHNCSKNASCDNNPGSFNCSCKPGFAGDGHSCLEIVGQNSMRPGFSCKDILERGSSAGDGEYWIDPEENGNPLKVYCDMTTDGGGWLLILNSVIYNMSPPTLSLQTSYRKIDSYRSNNLVLANDAINDLRKHLPFTQMRFYCSKPHGRTFHVATVNNSTGEAVIQYFTGQTETKPASCGSFKRLEGHNSYLSGQCAKWGLENDNFFVGKWGFQGVRELHNHTAMVKAAYHWITYVDNRWECDDYLVPASDGDFWKIFVR